MSMAFELHSKRSDFDLLEKLARPRPLAGMILKTGMYATYMPRCMPLAASAMREEFHYGQNDSCCLYQKFIAMIV